MIVSDKKKKKIKIKRNRGGFYKHGNDNVLMKNRDMTSYVIMETQLFDFKKKKTKRKEKKNESFNCFPSIDDDLKFSFYFILCYIDSLFFIFLF